MAEPATELSAEMLLREAAWLRRLAATLVSDAARADDLVQQTLLAALERRPPRVADPRAWLARVATNLARRVGLSDLRRSRRERATAPAEALPATDEIVARTTQLHRVVGAVLSLEEPYRAAVLLRFYDDLKPGAIARRLGVPVETVRTRLKRGLERLRAELVRRPEDVCGVAAFAWPHGAFAGAWGVVGMSTKWKLAAALVVLVGGTFTVAQLEHAARVARDARDADALVRAAPTASAALPVIPPVAVESAARAPIETVGAARIATKTRSARVPGRVVVGTVVDENGAPVSDAVVGLADDGGEAAHFGSTLLWNCRLADELVRAVESTTPIARRTTTAADGAFRFDSIEGPGPFRVVAVARDVGMGVETGVAPAAETETRVDVVLQPGVVVCGRVEDEARRTIDDAWISITVWEGAGPGQVSAPVVMARTDASGAFRSPPLPFTRFSFQCGADGFVDVDSLAPEVVAAGVHELRRDFTLKAGTAVTGRIVLADGTPAPFDRRAERFTLVGGTIDPRNAAAGPRYLGEAGRIDRGAARYTVDGRRGRARFVSLWSGDVLLGTADVVETGRGPDLVVDFTRIPPPPRKGAIELEVVDARDLRPVGEGSIALEWGRPALLDAVGEPRPSSRAQRIGTGDVRVRVDALEPGDWDVEVRATGFAARAFTIDVAEDAAPARRVVALVRLAGAVAGRVVDETGRGISGASLCLLDGEGIPTPAGAESFATSDADGAYRFPSAPEGPLIVVATSEHLAPSAVAVRAGEESGSVVLREGVALEFVPRRRGEDVYAACMVVVRDAHGIPLVDDRRSGRRILEIGRTFGHRLAAGDYTVEIIVPAFRCEPVRFTATRGAVVGVELTPRSIHADER